MSVYVDDAFLPWKSKRNRGRIYKFSHLIADTMEELDQMRKKLNLKREWLQLKSFPHYDVTKEKRRMAIRHGAIPLSQRQLIKKIKELKQTPEYNHP